MAGGSQDLLQPNNLALSWCKYTSMIPSLIRPFYERAPHSAALAPIPSPETLSLSFSVIYTHTHMQKKVNAETEYMLCT